jgi:hypothetical protein
MKTKEDGLIGLAVLIIIALILLKYFLNWSIFDAAASDQGKSTILYARGIFNFIWAYIAAPVTFIWYQIVLPVLHLSWDNFHAFLDWGHQTAAGAH